MTSPGHSYADASVTASAVIGYVAPPNAATPPDASPGDRRRSTTWWPSGVSWVSFTEPLSSTKNAAAGSPSRKNVCPASIAFVRAAARTALRAIESSVANNATGFANAASVTVAQQRVIASAVRRTPWSPACSFKTRRGSALARPSADAPLPPCYEMERCRVRLLTEGQDQESLAASVRFEVPDFFARPTAEQPHRPTWH